MTAKGQKSVTRRTFLQAAGGSLIGIAALPDVSLARTPKTGRNSGQSHDVIVMGGGFAGITAARDLAKHGYRVLVLEARNRLGGRTFSARFGDEPVELGGTWVHWGQGYVWAEMTRYGLSVGESPGFAPSSVSWVSGDAIKKGSGDDYAALLNSSMSKFSNVDGQEGRAVLPRPHDPLFNASAVRRYDEISMRDRLSQAGLAKEQQDVLDALLTVVCHNNPAEASFIEFLRWWTLGESEAVRMNDRLGRFKIKEGTHALIQAMADDAKLEVLLSTPVKAVEHGSERVKVMAVDGQTFAARALVVAIPMNVLDDVEFSPALSQGKVAAGRERHVGSGTKCYIRVKEKVGNWLGCAPYPAPLAMAWTEENRPDGTTLVAFGPPKALDITDDKAVEQALRRLLPEANVVSVMGYQWENDPYSQGTWCVYRPTQMTQRWAELQRAEGRCFFASSDSANGWRGFIDGAIESGIRVARDIHRTLA